MFKKKAFVVCNIAIVILEIGALVVRFLHYEKDTFLFYTVYSNIIAMFVCIFSVVMATKNRYYGTLYLWSACLLAFTFAVMCVGANSVEGGYVAMFLEGACIANHLVCPLGMIAIYLFLFPKQPDNFGSFLAVMTTLAYGTAMYLLNAFNVVVGPYFFFEVHSMPLAKTLLLLVTLVTMSLATSYIVQRGKLWADNKFTSVAK